jgi:hypothetical protein
MFTPYEPFINEPKPYSITAANVWLPTDQDRREEWIRDRAAYFYEAYLRDGGSCEAGLGASRVGQCVDRAFEMRNELERRFAAERVEIARKTAEILQQPR